MITISNEDYKKAVRLLKVLASSTASSLKGMETRRQARLLLWKWKNREAKEKKRLDGIME